MASTTTLKLPEKLKARIASAAQATGKAPHALMIDALSTQMTLFERRQAFIASAIKAEQEYFSRHRVNIDIFLKHSINNKNRWNNLIINNLQIITNRFVTVDFLSTYFTHRNGHLQRRTPVHVKVAQVESLHAERVGKRLVIAGEYKFGFPVIKIAAGSLAWSGGLVALAGRQQQQ